jgi:hypothetical protein
MRNLLIILLVCALASCSLPFGKKKAEQTSVKTEKGDRIQDNLPKSGDIKVVEGVEYIYAKNRKYMMAPYEPEYIWVRKDQYSPGLFETLTDKVAGGSANKKEKEELEKRMAKLEADLKNKNGQTPTGQQIVYLSSSGSLPVVSGGMPSFAYPSQKMKRRVLVLGLADQSNYKEEHLGDLATNRLISRLQNSNTVLCIDPRATNLTGDLSTPQVMKTLNEVYGIQAVIKGTLSDVYISTSRVEGKGNNEESQAMSSISLGVYDTETGKILRQLSARNPILFTKEKGEMSSERAKVKAVDLAIELLADDLLKIVLGLDWHARIAAVEGDKIFVDAGRQSGLQQGDILEVYAPGEQIIDKATNQPLGRTKGSFKGELEVSEVFGVDAAWAVAKKPASFAPTDLVYLKK